MPAKKKKAAPKKEDFKGEFKKTGSLIKQHLSKATKSREAKQVKGAVDKTLDALVVEINKLLAATKTSDIEKKVKTGAYKGVQKVNAQLEKQLKKWK